MFSAQRCLRLITFAFLLGSTESHARAQSARFISYLADSDLWTKRPAAPRPCSRTSLTLLGLRNSGAEPEDSGGACEDVPRSIPLVLNSCDSAIPAGMPCPQARDLVADNLRKLGKPGLKILNARQRILEILDGRNACSEWYALYDANPPATFRSINYLLDNKGEEAVQETRVNVSEFTYRNPYVASVIQNAGAGAAITLNPNGAFFRLVGPTIVRPKEGGFPRMGDVRAMRVGPYPGDSLKAQMLTLLHEFGHVLDMLPTDFNNVDGKSMRNSIEVLRYCRAEIEAPAKQPRARSLDGNSVIPY